MQRSTRVKDAHLHGRCDGGTDHGIQRTGRTGTDRNLNMAFDPGMSQSAQLAAPTSRWGVAATKTGGIGHWRTICNR